MVQKKVQVQIFFSANKKIKVKNILLVQKYLQIQKHVGSRIIEVQEKFWFEEKIWSKKMWVEKICYNNVLAKKTYWFTFLSFNSLFTEKFTIHVFTPWVLLCNWKWKIMRRCLNSLVWFVHSCVKQEMELLPYGKQLPVYLFDKRIKDISLLLALEDATYPSKV